MLDYDESPLKPPETVSYCTADNYHRIVASPSSIQLARQRLKRSFEETEAVNRVDSVMASRNRFQARTGGSESGYIRPRPTQICGSMILKSNLLQWQLNNAIESLRSHLRRLHEWSNDWLMLLNIDKCIV